MKRGLLVALMLACACVRDQPPAAPPEPDPGPARQIVDRVVSFEPAEGTKPEQLVVLLHGLGASADDLVPIARAWRTELPKAEFLLPDGIETWDGGEPARQWFSVRGVDDFNRADRVKHAAKEVRPWLDQELAKRGLGRKDLVLVGFSQGAMLAYELGLRGGEPAAAIVAYSGRLVDTGKLPEGTRPRILIVHGTQDQMIPVEHGEAAFKKLRDAGYDPELIKMPGVGHALPKAVIDEGGRFVKQAIAAR